MASSLPSPSDILARLLQNFKALKPSLNTNDQNSDFVIRAKALAGMISGLYADQAKVDNDSYISSARPEALDLKGADLGLARQAATQAVSTSVQITGTNGIVINPGDLTFLYVPTNVTYTNSSGGTITGGVLSVAAICQVFGQSGNIIAPDSLSLVSPPSGVGPTASILTSFTDGTDIESDDSYRARLLTREQQAPAGGNQNDYINFGFASDSSVRSVFIKRFASGLGTVSVYITTGTSDVDTAVTNGLPVVRTPSAETLETVQNYYDTHVPLTDCVKVLAPSEVAIDVTVNVSLASGLTLDSVPSSSYNPLNLSVRDLIVRETKRAMYKTSVGGRKITTNGSGYLYASDIEIDLDVWLSAVIDPVTGTYEGKIPVLADRRVQNLAGSSANFLLTENQIPVPGAITVNLNA